MLVKSLVALSMTAFAAAAPLRRSVDLTERAPVATVEDLLALSDAELGSLFQNLAGNTDGLLSAVEGVVKRDIVNADVDTTIGHKSHANADVVIKDNLDTSANVDAKLGHLLGLNVDANVGLGRLLHRLLGGLLKRDLTLSTEDLAKRSDILDADVNATLGKHTAANVAAKVGKDVVVDVDAKVGRLLGLDVNANLGLGKLLKNILSLGGLIHKRDDVTLDLDSRIAGLLSTDLGVRVSLAELLRQLTHLDVQVNVKRDIVNADVDTTIGHKSHANADVVVKDNLDTSVTSDVKLGHLLGLNLNTQLGLSKLLKSLLGGLHTKRDAVTLDVDASISRLLTTNAAAKVEIENFITALLGLQINAKRSLVDTTVLASADSNGINSGTVVDVANTQIGVGELINSDGVAAGVKVDSPLAQADSETVLNKSGLATGTVVSSGSVNAGVGAIATSSGDISTGVVANVGNAASANVGIDLGLAKVLHGLLGGLLARQH